MDTKHTSGPKFEKVKAPIIRDSHTPGPWVLNDCLKSWVVYGPDGSIAEINRFADKPNAAHNARLIAAAPELLDLAKAALTQLEKMDFTCSANWNGSIKTNVILLLEAAIAKAEGRE